MTATAVAGIHRRLQQLPEDKLAVVHDFVSYLADREAQEPHPPELSEARQTMLASEDVLRRDWERPEEEAAWAHL
jgi:hypothetical protein